MNKHTLIAFIAEIGPLVIFFVAGQITDFFTAVAWLMGSTLLAVVTSLAYSSRIPWIPIISALFVLVGGTITLFFQTPDAIILADTIYYMSMSAWMLFSLLTGRHILRWLFGAIFAVNETGWRILEIRWCVFLLVAALGNEAARYLLPPELWIDYRFYQSIVVGIFSVAQFGVSSRYRLVAESTSWGIRTTHPKR